MNNLNILGNKEIKILIILFFSLIFTSCATNPVSGMPDFVTITEQQEISIGKSYHETIIKENSRIMNFLSKFTITLDKLNHFVFL